MNKQQSENKEEAVEMTIEEFLAIRKEAGLKIDPETAEVDWDLCIRPRSLWDLSRPAG